MEENIFTSGKIKKKKTMSFPISYLFWIIANKGGKQSQKKGMRCGSWGNPCDGAVLLGTCDLGDGGGWGTNGMVQGTLTCRKDNELTPWCLVLGTLMAHPREHAQQTEERLWGEEMNWEMQHEASSSRQLWKTKWRPMHLCCLKGANKYLKQSSKCVLI